MKLLLSLTAIAIATAGYAAPPPKDEKKSNKDKIVGTWELVKTSQGDLGGQVLHLEFTKDGKMIMNRMNGKMKQLVYEAKYKVEGDKEDKMPYESITEGVDKKETLKIKKLTDKELVFEDDDGIVEEFSRVMDVKKDEKKKSDQ
ncbi:MAG TPA: hypothetical protein VGJ05_18085 [Fimbriiglobus sp.]|jgi:uncharacterized protein (TIGR03066 family)